MHSNNVGTIGELAVRQELLRQGYKVYLPEVDANQVDMVVEMDNGSFKRVQVKTVRNLKTSTSIEIRCAKHVKTNRVDVIAVYYPDKGVAFVPYNNEPVIMLALTTAKNNQKSKRKWIYQYERFPEFS